MSEDSAGGEGEGGEKTVESGGFSGGEILGEGEAIFQSTDPQKVQNPALHFHSRFENQWTHKAHKVTLKPHRTLLSKNQSRVSLNQSMYHQSHLNPPRFTKNAQQTLIK